MSLVDRNELSSIFIDCDLSEPKGATMIQNLRYLISDQLSNPFPLNQYRDISMSSFLFQNNSQIVQILVHRPLKELQTVVEIILNRLLKSFKVRLTSHLNILVFLGLFFLLRFNFSYIEKHCSNQVLFFLSRKLSSLYKRLLKEN